MGDDRLEFDAGAAEARLLRYLAIEGITGHEKAIGRAVAAELAAVGVPRRHIRFDRANESIPVPTETGNLIVHLEGTRQGPRLLFSTHLDTVPLCAGARPEKRGRRIIAAGATALGGDNRTGVACLVTLAATLLQRRCLHPPLTLLFTVREESGLWGARFVNRAELLDPAVGFNVDGGAANKLTIGAVGAERWEVDVHGRAAHAGVYPEKGISATAVASLALAEVVEEGWFGKIRRDEHEGTSNVGSFGGADGLSAGTATNVVTDHVKIRGESRSHDRRFVKAITAAYRAAFRRAAGRVRDDRGRAARIRFQSRLDYHPFRLKPSAAVVQQAIEGAHRADLEPILRSSNGGLDANWLVRHGIPTVSFGAGQNNIHAVGEFVELDEFLRGCKLALALATAPA